jgi:hypothetical protein
VGPSARKLHVVITGDAKGLNRAFKDATKSTTGFGKSMQKFRSTVSSATKGLVGLAAGYVSISAAKDAIVVPRAHAPVIPETEAAERAVAALRRLSVLVLLARPVRESGRLLVADPV